ncbi:MAG: Maf family protein [Parvibaculum sp.]|nr:Maf family protein [Parvibaculum sp.]
MTSTPLILASASAGRARLLRDAGLTFETADSRVDEEALKRGFAPGDNEGIKAPEADTDALALKLAEAKALAVSAINPGALVIGADQILSCAGKPYDKPKSMDEARSNLLAFRGQPHILHNGLVLARDGTAIWHNTVCAILTMRDFSDSFLDAYLAQAGETVMKSVGCYQLEGPGVQLIKKIEGDYFTILGLPLLPLLGELRRLGVVAT